MKRNANRRGSALLIVIGMLSFMVISAVSFAIFMRQGRLPSSYLRRNASARYLLKAALANAIARIDGQLSTENGYCEGILDDVYPGVGPTKNYNPDPDNEEDLDAESDGGNTVSAEKAKDGDYWVKRVFCPFGLVKPDETVSTLTLEALAYLPPAIINEVRVLSRRTQTAKWRSLTYDAGRYAFCAVDVSDCFDINKLRANECRTSYGNTRVNLSALFPDKGSALDTILDDIKVGGQEIPFVSLADFNIVAGGQSPFSPFAQGLGTKDGINPYVDQNHQTVSNALFITDTWFPSTNTTTAANRYFDLETDKDQPFGSFSDSAKFMTAQDAGNNLNAILRKNIGSVGLACLYDYLDENNRPTSLVIPTVETVPMVVGVGLGHNGNFRPGVTPAEAIKSKSYPDPANDPNTTYYYLSQKYSLTQLLGNKMKIYVHTAFPFKRVSAKKNFSGSFKGEVLVRVFFGPKELPSRLDMKNNDSPLYPAKGDWATGGKRGVFTIKGTLDNINFGDVRKTADAVKRFSADIEQPTVDAPLFHYVKKMKVVKDPDTGAETETETEKYYSLDGIKDSDNALVPRDADGKELAWWTAVSAGKTEPVKDGEMPSKATASGELSADEYVPHVLVWVRIMNNRGETVDIVPASVEDDDTWGTGRIGGGSEGKFGEGTPILEFRGDETRAFKYDETVNSKLDGSTPDTFPLWTQLYAADPRYNHAPENWFAVKDVGGAAGSEWLTAIGADKGTPGGIIGLEDSDAYGEFEHDRDIFMFTSDRGTLQSIGELAFLPYVQEMNGQGKLFQDDLLNECTLNGADFAKRLLNGTTLSDTKMFANGKYLWRTYSAFDKCGEEHGSWDPIYTLTDGSSPVEIVAGQGGFRVNPFSPDRRVLMAVVKDTPFDYAVAMDNTDRNKVFGDGANADLSEEAQEHIVGRLYEQFQSWARNTTMARFDWGAAFRNLPWANESCNDEQKLILDDEDDDDRVTLTEPLHGVDRKFLFSFWRECFQNRQQLFLIFLRAEPLTVGGMGEGSLASSQLGARGVALVWRDPQPPSGDNNRANVNRESMPEDFFEQHKPHKTRVLFYHQFD